MRRRKVPLAERVDALAQAVDLARGRLRPEVVQHAATALERVRERAALSAEHTVVAVAGATGVGKSSVFNALAGSDLARTGTMRPTTSHAMALVSEVADLSAGSTALLEWLGVPDRHERPVTAASPDGLILLDLPDHDSVVAEHRERADHITDRADLLVWVTSPQKYADDVLHTRYLKPLAGSDTRVVVLLNQSDRLSPDQARECREDLERLVRADGVDARVLTGSALDGDGMDSLAQDVARAVRSRETARLRATGEVATAARSLLGELPSLVEGAAAAQHAREHLVEVLEEAAGIPRVVDAVGAATVRDAARATGWPPTRWIQRFRSDPLRTLGLRGGSGGESGGARTEADPATDVPRRTSLPPATPQSRAKVTSATRAYVHAAASALPPAWGDAVSARVVSGAADLADSLDQEIARGVSVQRPAWWRWVGTVQWVLMLTLLAGLAWLLALAVIDFLQLPQWPVPVLSLGEVRWPWPSLLAIGGAVLGIALAALARLAARRSAARRMRQVRARLRRAVERHASDRVLAVVDGELAASEALRTAAVRAGA
ncbi:GTPase family protein [Serinibacter salmoneus]|uniref:Putative GTPase n=1 Tax=Serinibacter salmoneus TaxID=556530 RepID=A0A2A9D1X8_9MICO|nr:GTPase [Serinibacter salmoneus]PFG19952.1 putative GTPase [Serinibacter salmoneus]